MAPKHEASAPKGKEGERAEEQTQSDPEWDFDKAVEEKRREWIRLGEEQEVLAGEIEALRAGLKAKGWTEAAL